MLFQVFFHATIAAEEGWFTLRRCHVHGPRTTPGTVVRVFGQDAVLRGALSNWEPEGWWNPHNSIMDGIPDGASRHCSTHNPEEATAGFTNQQVLADTLHYAPHQVRVRTNSRCASLCLISSTPPTSRWRGPRTTPWAVGDPRTDSRAH